MSTAATKRILGIDPGTNILGYSVIEITGKAVSITCLGIIRLDKFESHYEKLKVIFEKISYFIEEYDPTAMAIETPFYGKNAQSMLKLGRAQGVAIAAAAVNLIPVFEYAPRKIKQSITGNGNASKEQVSDMLQNILKLETMPKYFDATDALGVALCHYFQNNNPRKSNTKGASNWKSYIAENPGKVKS